MKKLVILLMAICGGAVIPVDAADLKESKFTQVVNDVQIISTTDNSKHPAAVDAIFKIPDVIRTGPASRAELVADDRTITRVGANTIFSFDQANRSIHLEKGSLLFNSPKGKGGGSIHTAAATAAVIGTTIIVTTTPNGGFKVLTLEGKTEVQFANGLRQQVQAGQMTFVLPGGQAGPVIMFRLDQQIAGSSLVKGFVKPLPSQPKIDAVVTKQVKEIKTGKVADTGLHVGDEATPTGVQVIQLFDQVSASSTNGTIPGLNASTTPASTRPTLPEGFVVPPRLVFDATQGGFTASSANNLFFVSSGASGTNPPTRIEAAAAPADAALDPQSINSPLAANDPRVTRERVDIYSVNPDELLFPSFTGFIGQSIAVNTPTIDLNQYAPLDRFIFLAVQDFSIAADLTIAASQIPMVEMIAGAGHSVQIASGKTLTVDSPNFAIDSPTGFTLANSTVQKLNNAGLLEITSGGPVSLNNSFLSGGNVTVSSGGAFSATGDSHTTGGITGDSVVINSSGGSTIGVNVNGNGASSVVSVQNNSGALTVNNGAIITAGFVSLRSPGGVTLNGISDTGNSFSVNGGNFGGNPVAVQNSSFDLTGSFGLQNNGGSLVVGGTDISAGSVSINSSSDATFTADRIDATSQANLFSSSGMTLSDTPVTASNVRLTTGGALTTSGATPAAGKVQGNASVTLNSGSGMTLGTDVTAGSLSAFNSSGTLTVNPGVTVQAASSSLSSPGGILVDGATLAGGEASLSGGSGFGAGTVNVRNNTVSLTGGLTANSRGGVQFDTVAVTSGSLSITAGDPSFTPNPGAAPARITKSTFDVAGGANVQNNSGTFVMDNSSRITASESVIINSRDGATIDHATLNGSQITVDSGNNDFTAAVTVQNSGLTASGPVTVNGNSVSLNNTTVSAGSDLNVQSGSITLNNTTLGGDRVTIASDGFISAPNVAPNNGAINGNSEVTVASQSGGMTLAVDVTANTTSGTINLQNNGGILSAGGGKIYRAAFINVSSPGGLLFDGTTVNGTSRVNMTAGSQPGTLAVVQNTSFTGAADVNIAGHTVVLNQVNFASGSSVSLSSALGQLAPSPNTGQQVQNGFVNYIQNVNYGGAPAQDFTGLGKPITIHTLP